MKSVHNFAVVVVVLVDLSATPTVEIHSLLQTIEIIIITKN